MKTKDIEKLIGQAVAVSAPNAYDRHWAARRAYVVGVGWSRRRGFLGRSVTFSKGGRGIALAMSEAGVWMPVVLPPNHVIAPWSEYQKARDAALARRKAADEEAREAQVGYEERCAEAPLRKRGTFLWPKDVHGMVQISPDDFFRFVEAMKGRLESLERRGNGSAH